MMKRHSLYILLIALLSISVFSCKDDANDWGCDMSYDALFRSVTFSVLTAEATSVEMKYTGVLGATKYIFEFSEGDSLQFNNIIRKDTILADTLTAYLESSSISKTEYHTIFEDLKGVTKYSVRMKAIDEINNKESGYMQSYFITRAEQILTNVVASIDKITLEWLPEKKVTHVFVGELIEGQDTVFVDRHMISDSEKVAKRATVEGLTGGTNYMVFIYNGDARRGEMKIKTLGTQTGTTIRVQPGDVVSDILKQQAEQGATDVALLFKGELPYEFESVTIPAGIDKLYFVGEVELGGKLPELYLHKLTLSGAMSNIAFQYVDINARSNSSNYVFNINNENVFSYIDFTGCTIRNIGRSLIYFSKDNLTVGAIRINNCIVQNVGKGGYGLINIGKAMAEVGTISITNTTMMEIGDQLMQTNAGITNVEISKCIFCNYTMGIPKIFRFDKQPGTVSVKNTIFAGTNNGTTVNSGNGDYSSYLDFFSCYLTSDFVVNKNKFTNAEILKMTSEEMFVDPRNGDFHLKEGVKFAGEGVVGDPRWWK